MGGMSAEAFIRTVLVGRLAAREVHVGPEFRFGHRRTGDLGTLQREVAEHGFTAEAIAPVMLDGERVSSTRIRAAHPSGDFDAATRLLGAPSSIGGRVVRGRQLGRTPGYPTAHLRVSETRPAPSGYSATRVPGVGY